MAWSQVAAALAAPALTRRELADAVSRLLLHRNRVVLQQTQGDPWQIEVPELPSSVIKPKYARHGELGRRVLQTPGAEVEPRFLVAGSHFETAPHGTGRVITSRAEGPLFRLTWIHPVGIGHDRWACDAIQAKADALSIPGLEASPRCWVDESGLEIVGVAARFEQAWPELIAWLRSDALPDEAVAKHIDSTLRWRAAERGHPHGRDDAVFLAGAYGPAGLNAMLPSDAELRRDGPARIPESLRRVGGPDPDVLYSGPVPDRVRELLPTPGGVAPPPRIPHPVQRFDRPTVFMLDDPDRQQAVVRVMLPAVAEDAPEAVASLVFNATNALAAYEMPFHAWVLHGAVTGAREWPQMHGVVAECDHEEVVQCTQQTLDLMRRRPDRRLFRDAHALLEAAFRAERVAAADVPSRVRAWEGDVNPRVALWFALPGLSFETFVRVVDELAETAPIITVVGDSRRIGPGLESLGDVVEVDLEQAMRDSAFYEIDHGEPEIIAARDD